MLDRDSTWHKPGGRGLEANLALSNERFEGTLPEGKDPQALDQKLMSRYDVAKTEGARRWRKSQGLGYVQYVR